MLLGEGHADNVHGADDGTQSDQRQHQDLHRRHGQDGAHHWRQERFILAVVQEIDAEMDARLAAISASAPDEWSAFAGRCRAYLAMTIEPQVQRILLRDSPSVLGRNIFRPAGCNVSPPTNMLQKLMEQRTIATTAPEVLAHLINGGLMDAALWIANQQDEKTALEQALAGLTLLLNGLRPRAA